MLIQPHTSKASRTFSDHETIPLAIECETKSKKPLTNFIALIKGYEHRLKELNPHTAKLNYVTKDLMEYIDDLPDVAILTYAREDQLLHYTLLGMTIG